MATKKDFGRLGTSFTLVRALQAVSLIIIIGITSNFASVINQSNQTVPSILIATLVIATLAALWTFLAYVMYHAEFFWMLPWMIMSDALLLIACIVVASLLGKPLASLDCSSLPTGTSDTSDWIASVALNINKYSYDVWIGASQAACYETKAVWGLSISLCILFFLSIVFEFVMYMHLKPKVASTKDNTDNV